MAITGDPFVNYVRNQIITRQNALGEGLSLSDPRKVKTLQAYNSKTPWIRLASAVRITTGDSGSAGTSVWDEIENKELFNGIDWQGDGLSKNFVLFGSANNNIGTNPPQGVISPVSSPLQGAYGFGSNQLNASQKRGYVPPPGITNVSFDYKNDGALAYAIVDITAYSENQFSMIDILFQRPGYTCLLEFGHSLYLDNNGDLSYPDTYSTSPFEFLYSEPGKGANYTAMAQKIQKEKEKWNGNYEGFFARITKFQWSFNPDGSYNITVNLVGMGDVISSLKVNLPKTTNIPTTFKIDPLLQNIEVQNKEDNNFPLISEAISSQLNFELYSIYKSTQYPIVGDSNASDIEIIDVPVKDQKLSQIFQKGVFKVKPTDNGVEDESVYSPTTYIQFRVFLSILQKICNVKDNFENHLLSFDLVNNVFDEEKNNIDDTYIVTYPGNFSSNPNKCLIPYTSFKSKITKVGLDTTFPLNENLGKDPNPIKDIVQPELAMRLSHVYVNLNFITQILKNVKEQDKDNEGNISLLDLLQDILKGINRSLGNQNNFRVLFDEATNTIKIISETPIVGFKPTTETPYSQLNTFGLTAGEGSFVTAMNLNSELSDDFATMVTIGAQANSNTDLAGATSFSTYNKGLVDRLFPEKKSPQEKKEKTPEEDPINKIFDVNVRNTFIEVYQNRQFGNTYVSTLESINQNLAQKVINKYSQLSISPVPFFLPFNFSLTMDGLSGMKIYQAFQIQGRGLPPSYNPQQMSLIIKGLSHSVSQNGWETKVETLSKPEVKISTISTGDPNPPSFAYENVESAEGNLTPPPGELPPDDEQLRLRVFRIMDDGDQTLGFYEVLNEDESTVLYRLAVSELPWKGNQNSISAIPTGKYRVKSYQNKKYGKCFWYIGNEAGNYANNQLFGNGYIRTDVLIHRAPKAVGWLEGCQGPGFKFNVKNNQKGRQQGTGDAYLDPSLRQSNEALAKLVGTLWDVGSFRVEIQNYFDVLPTSWEDERVQTLVKDLQLV